MGHRVHAVAHLCPALPLAAENLIEYQLKRTVDFEIDEHRKRLAEVETAVNPGVVPVGDGAGDPVVLTCHPTDRVELMDLATTGDAAFNKIIIVLTALCDEVAFLRSHAEAKYFAQLSLFGHSKEDDNAEYGEGVLEAMMGRSLPVLKDAAAFSARCATLVLHFVHQLAAIYGRVRAVRARLPWRGAGGAGRATQRSAAAAAAVCSAPWRI